MSPAPPARHPADLAQSFGRVKHHIVTTQNRTLNFELYFDLSPDLLCIAGYDGYFVKVNPAVSKLLGYSNEELKARPIHEFIYSEDKERTAAHREKILQDIPLLNFENRYVTKSGEIVWLSWTSMPVKSDQIVFAIAKNITHLKRSEEARNRIMANLTKVNSDLKLLTYKTSHDLRAPVNNLLSTFTLLDVSKIQDEETLVFIDILKLSTERLKETLNDYVDSLKQEDTLQVQTEELDLHAALHNVLQSLSSLLHNSKTTLQVDFSQADKIVFNQQYLESIFLNLITNAIKYARPGVCPEITIHTRQSDDMIQLVVADNGLGFDMDKVKDKVFGFHQKFHDHSDSKGIGLYLVYNHITSLGGRIALESKVNEGARFTISLKKMGSS